MAICLRNEQHEPRLTLLLSSDKLAPINRPDKDKHLRLIDPLAVTLFIDSAHAASFLNDSKRKCYFPLIPILAHH